jgi:Fe2+ or Zn2+ uptake regulation protein
MTIKRPAGHGAILTQRSRATLTARAGSQRGTTTSAIARRANPERQRDGELVLRQLSARGFRETEARRAIVETILHKDGQFTARQLHEELEPWDVGRATVFRTLDLLVELGVLNRLHTDERCSSYVVCADQHHHHLVCERCGTVQEVSDPRIERAVRAMAVDVGFRAREHRLEIVGICDRCQDAS